MAAVIREEREEDAVLYEQYVYHAAGFNDGAGIKNDSPMLCRRDTSGDGVPDVTLYFMTNSRGDVTAVTDVNGKPYFRLRYSAYGVPYVLRVRDHNADYILNSQDFYDFMTDYNAGHRRADVNLDGSVTSQDFFDFMTDYNATDNAGRGHASTDANGPGGGPVGNRFGFAGYWWDEHLGIYHVRKRAYDPYDGRWMQRDPIRMAGGWNLYQYCGGDPLAFVDPFGLARDWFDHIVDFSAGVADSLSMGATDWIREAAGWNDTVDHESGAYIAGEVTETAVEVALTGGSALLKKGAAKVGSKAAQQAARSATKKMRRELGDNAVGKFIHHINVLVGHPANVGTKGLIRLLKQTFPPHFPLGGLSRAIHSHRWNLIALTAAEHAARHVRIIITEAVYGTVFNPVTTAIRIVRNVWSYLTVNGDDSDAEQPSTTQAQDQGDNPSAAEPDRIQSEQDAEHAGTCGT